jgi:drug/metabolite transporter (DMT)-like permease
MRKAFFQLHLSILLAGFTGILGKLIQVNEAWLVWYRLLLTVITIGLIQLFVGSKHSLKLVPVQRKNTLHYILIGLVVGVHWITFYGAIKYSNVSVALVSFSTLGFFSAILEGPVLKKKINLTEMMLGLLSVLGVSLIFAFDYRFQKGILFGLISAFLAALFTVLNKKFGNSHPPFTVTAWEMIGGLAAVTLILPLYLSVFDLSWQIPKEFDWLWLVVLAWFCTIWSFRLSLSALRIISPFTVNLSYNLEPVYGILMAFAFFHENKDWTIYMTAGILCIAVAIIWQMVRVWRPKPVIST